MSDRNDDEPPPKLGLARKRFNTMRAFVKERQAAIRDDVARGGGLAAVVVWWTLFEACDAESQIAVRTLKTLSKDTGLRRETVVEAINYLEGVAKIIERRNEKKRQIGRYYVHHYRGEN